MRKYLCLLPVALVLFGCSATNEELEEALAFRSRLLGSGGVRFNAEISADYGDRVEQFCLNCRTDQEGNLTFEVEEPEEIAGIGGTVTGEKGSLDYSGMVLGFPLMADGRLSPVGAPWVMVKALRTGCLTATVREGELLHLTVDDSYADDALTLEIWLDGEEVEACEIAWQGKRVLTMELGSFSFL